MSAQNTGSNANANPNSNPSLSAANQSNASQESQAHPEVQESTFPRNQSIASQDRKSLENTRSTSPFPQPQGQPQGNLRVNRLFEAAGSKGFWLGKFLKQFEQSEVMNSEQAQSAGKEKVSDNSSKVQGTHHSEEAQSAEVTQAAQDLQQKYFDKMSRYIKYYFNNLTDYLKKQPEVKRIHEEQVLNETINNFLYQNQEYQINQSEFSQLFEKAVQYANQRIA